MMDLHAIVSVDKYGAIGRDGKLALRLPKDLQHFKKTTMGFPIIMGRITHEEIGRALDGRMNIVLSRDWKYKSPGCTVVHSADEAIYEAGNFCTGMEKKAFVIGGQRLFQNFWHRVKVLHLTLMDVAVKGADTYFHLDPMQIVRDFPIIHFEAHQPDDKHPVRYCFYQLEVPADYDIDLADYWLPGHS
jgi:dihydrofolate reductase